jgi:hypothetical protein
MDILNVSSLYWHVFRRWRHLRYAVGEEYLDETGEEIVLLEESGQRITFLQAYPHRGRVLQGLSLYDYMSVVKLKRKGETAGRQENLEFDSTWPLSQKWVQTLRDPGKQATVCLDGYLCMDFSEDDQTYYKRYVLWTIGFEQAYAKVEEKINSIDIRTAVQHLALFVPWERFLSETAGDINAIWEREKLALSRRILYFVDNIQLLCQSAEDAKRDAKQWAAMSGETDAMTEAFESGLADGDDKLRTMYRSDNIGNATRFIDVLRSAIASQQITANSKEISALVQKLYRFQATALCSAEDLHAMIVPEEGERILNVSGQPFSGAEIPRQKDLRHIKSQQKSLSKEREKIIQGIQRLPDINTEGHSAAVYSVLNGSGDQNVHIVATDSETPTQGIEPFIDIQFGISTSFSEAGRQLAESFTLNRRQSIALQVICHC